MKEEEEEEKNNSWKLFKVFSSQKDCFIELAQYNQHHRHSHPHHLRRRRQGDGRQIYIDWICSTEQKRNKKNDDDENRFPAPSFL